MKNTARLFALIFAVFVFSLAANASLPEGAPATVKITSGAARFDSTSNVPGVSVNGKSNAVAGEVNVIDSANGLVLQSIKAILPVNTLTTGMKVRDEHMRKLIFTNSNGEEPDLHFDADNVTCAPRGSGREFGCAVTGRLQIRGIAKPIEVSLRIKQQGAGEVFKVDGDGLVKLSDYGIAPPTQFGVALANEVKFHVELTGKGQGAQ